MVEVLESVLLGTEPYSARVKFGLGSSFFQEQVDGVDGPPAHVRGDSPEVLLIRPQAATHLPLAIDVLAVTNRRHECDTR